MAKKRKRASSTTSKRRSKKSTRKSGLMGLPASTNSGSTGQKVASGALLLAATLVGGGLGTYAGKSSGVIGAGLVLGSSFMPSKFVPYALASGAAMVIASPKASEAAPPQPTEVSGIASLDSAKQFHAQGTSRFKNFLSELSSKFGAQKQVNKMIGLGDVAYMDESIFSSPEYARMQQLAKGTEGVGAIDPLLAGVSPLLAGINPMIY